MIAYDVGEDHRRARLAALLSRHGVRRQLSVFECELEGADLEGLLTAATTLLNPARDRLAVYPQCESCAERQRSVGVRSEVLEARFYIV